MKNISNILRRSNITPLERVTVFVHSDIHRERTGKEILSESDQYALIKGWNANAYEVKEYNKYINIIQLESSMKMDAQMFLYKSELALLRNQRVLDNFISNTKRFKAIAKQLFTEDVSIEESLKFLIKNTYFQYGRLLHLFTFNNLSKEIQKDLLLLDREIANCEKYLEDQVFLYERFENNKTLSKPNKELIIDRIYSHMYYEGVKKIKNSTSEKDGFLLHSFFAELPIKDLFKKIINDEHVEYVEKDTDSEENILFAIEECAKSKNISIEQLVKEKLLLWLNNGLFVKEYSPLFMSKRFDAWNGNTKKNHKELFMAWYKELQKSKQYFDRMFLSKKLEKKMIVKDFLGVTKTLDVITGCSLYDSTEDVDFIKEYKKQIGILLPISNLFLFVEKYATTNINYQTLCEFKNLAQKTSFIFDIDMTEKYQEFINSYKEEVALMNFNLDKLIDIAIEYLYTEESLEYILDIKDSCFMFKLDTDNKVKVANIAKMYSGEFKKLGT